MDLTALAGVTLGVGMLGSLVYELWRVMARGDVSEYDTKRRFVQEQVPFYLVATIFVGALLINWQFASVAGLAFAVLIWAYSAFQYMPKTYQARKPGFIDDVEAIWFLGAVGAAAVLMAAQLAGLTLTP